MDSQDSFLFSDPRKTPRAVIQTRGDLPHLYKEGATYFVTFRLRDAVVSTADRQLSNSVNKDRAIAQNATPIRPMFCSPADLMRHVEPPLRQGSCLLADPRAAVVVQHALRHGHARRYHLHAWCIMPNHVHIVLTPYADQSLSSILAALKSFASHEINKCTARKGTLWEQEWFDHVIRTSEHLRAFVDYVEENPVTAGLCTTAAEWAFSSASSAGE